MYTLSLHDALPISVLVMVTLGAWTMSVALALTLLGLPLLSVAVGGLFIGTPYPAAVHAQTSTMTLAPEARLPMASVSVPPVMVPASVVQLSCAESGSGSLRLTL